MRPRGERALAGDEDAEPKIRPSTKETLSPARSSVDKAAARLVNAERRVANAERELQDAEAWWRIASLRMKLKALQDAEGAELKIRPSKKETPIPASAPDAKNRSPTRGRPGRDR